MLHSFSAEVHQEPDTRTPPKHQAAVLEITVADSSATSSPAAQATLPISGRLASPKSGNS